MRVPLSLFLPRVLLSLICILASPLLAGKAPPPAGQIRGIWIVRHQLKEYKQIDKILAFAAKNGFTDLFVQVRGRGDAYYRSRYEPPAEGLKKGIDPLGYLLKKARNYPFRVHAWMNIFYVWSREKLPNSPYHLVHQRPEWLAEPLQYNRSLPDRHLKNRRNSEGLYLSPVIPGVQQHLLRVIKDILSRYPVDGLHLDYIRYPDQNFDFNPQVRAAFKRKYLLDPLKFKKYPEKFRLHYGETGFEIFFTRWGKFLSRSISEWVHLLARETQRDHPELILSAAVKPELPKAHWHFYQEWEQWLAKGWIDWAIPMNYAANNKKFLQRVQHILGVASLDKVLMGISLYNQSPVSAMKKVHMIQELGLKGFVLFSLDTFISDRALQKHYLTSLRP